MPQAPFTKRSHDNCTPVPRGLTMPSPVTTALLDLCIRVCGVVDPLPRTRRKFFLSFCDIPSLAPRKLELMSCWLSCFAHRSSPVLFVAQSSLWYTARYSPYNGREKSCSRLHHRCRWPNRLFLGFLGCQRCVTALCGP